MKLAIAANSTPSRKRAPRRGLATGLLLLLLVFLSGFVALGVNIVRLRQLQGELRLVCRASALAGAAELLDEGVLFGRPGLGDDVVAARQAALVYGQINRVSGRPVLLDPNLSNKPLGDVVIGAYDPAGPVGLPLVLPSDDAPIELNTVRVTARMSRNVSNRVSLWFGALLGIAPRDVAATAQASLDRRVAGFRPELHVRVPMAPLVADYETWLDQATAPASADANDLYAVDYQTGAVVAGSDGVAEITLILGGGKEFGRVEAGQSSQSASCSAMLLSNDGAAADPWFARCQSGLSQGDLALFGGQLVIVGGVCPVSLETTVPADLPYALMDVIGQCRAWPLAEPGPYGANVSYFAAGRIVAVRRAAGSSSNNWEIVVQPSTLVCSQAVASITMTPNPWIAKLELTQ